MLAVQGNELLVINVEEKQAFEKESRAGRQKFLELMHKIGVDIFDPKDEGDGSKKVTSLHYSK